MKKKKNNPVTINNIATPSHNKTEYYDENVMWAGECYDYLYNYFKKDIKESQTILPKISEYYQVSRKDIINEWVKEYSFRYLKIG